MRCRAVCFSGPGGTHMHEVAAGVALKLGFTLVDEAIVTRAASEAGVGPSVVASVEKRKAFMGRLLDTLSSSSDATGRSFLGGVTANAPDDTPRHEDFRWLIRSAIEETAARGDVVIVSHAASHALARNTDILRVLVTASADTRCVRFETSGPMSRSDAARVVDAADVARADYLKRFYAIKEELPTQYDLVINTDRLAIDDAVAMITLAAGG